MTLISEDYLFEVIKDYFKKNGVSDIQKESYNYLITNTIQQIINEDPVIKIPIKQNQYFMIEITDVIIDNPYIIEENRKIRYITPNEARLRDLTYDAPISLNITEKLVNILDNKEEILEVKYHNKIIIGRLPIMLQSIKCNLFNKTESEKIKAGECKFDSGGYFIIRGKERVLVSQERMNYNSIHVFKQKKSSKYTYIADIRSMSEETGHSILIQAKISNNNEFLFSIPYINQDIPIGIIFKAFGYTETKQLYKILNRNQYNKDIIDEIIKNSFFIKTKEDALNYIGKFAMHTISKEKRYDYTIQILENELLPHLGICSTNKEKALFLSLMFQKLVNTYLGKRNIDDRDHISNKRCEMAGVLIADIFRALYKRFVRSITPHLQKRQDVLIAISRINTITQGLSHCFATGNWAVYKNSYVRKGVSQILNRLSYIGTLSHLRRLLIPIGKEGKNTDIRQIHNSQYGYVCPAETPEGHSAGIVKNFSLMIKISNKISSIEIKNILLKDTRIILLHNLKENEYFKYYKIMLNGVWIGSIENEEEFIEHLRLKRKNKILPLQVSISLNIIDREVLIFSDEGRMLRPLLTVNKHGDLNLTQNDNVNWDELVQNNKIEYLDSYEIENMTVAMYEKELSSIYDYNYCEIHPSLVFSVCASVIPYPDHTQSPRNTYISAMCKQGMGLYATSNNVRSDTIVHVLQYPQKPAMFTHMAENMNMNTMASGINAIVAIMCYGGYNQEDSVIINEDAINRGLFRSFAYRTIVTEERKKSTNIFETICLPNKDIQKNHLNYQKLDENGIVQIGEIIEKGDVIVGKVTHHISKNGEEKLTDCSLTVKNNECGIVDKVYISTTPSGYKMIKIKMRRYKIPEMGDKFVSREAQKGTCGIVLKQADMPFTQDGVTPDIIINPHCIPSRMTINQLLECIGAKSTVINGKFKYCTAFSKHSTNIIDNLKDELKSCGFNKHGNEVMISGVSGKILKSDIFIGPVYYKRLKHLVSEKIHARDYGSVQCLTRQPLEGRSRDGGLRFGEMERDCMISHGVTRFLKERLFDMSDPYNILLCSNCGQISTNKNECHICKNENIFSTNIPYACKLLFQELIAIGIKINLIPKYNKICY